MSYKYAAATTYQSPRPKSARQATSASGSTPRSYQPSIAVTAEDDYGYSTHDRWATAQSPTVHSTSSSLPKHVHFATPLDQAGYLQPQSRHHRADSPLSQASSVPSLSHSADVEDDLRYPPTPELRPVPLAPESRRSSRPSSGPYQASYTAISQIIHELNTSVQAFQHPRDLDFEAPRAGSSAPALAYTAKNRPLLEHNQKLEKLQARLDAVESFGDRDVRKVRKEAVTMVELELEGLKRVQARMWSKLVHEQNKTHRSHRR